MSKTPPSSRSRSTIARFPLTSFVVIGLTFAYLATALPLLAEFEIIPGRALPERVGIDMEEAASLLMLIGIFSAALLVTHATEGRRGVAQLVRRMTRWRVSPGWWLTALVALPLGTVVLAVVFGDTATVPPPATLAAEAGSILFALAVVNMMEETTWTGFLQTRLERRLNLFIAAVVVAVPFALVHLPLRVISHEVESASGLLGAFVVLMILGTVIRVLFAAVARGAVNSILIVAATHTMFNRSNNTDGIAADILTGPNRQSAALLMLLILTVAVLLATRRRLGRTYRQVLDEQETTHHEPLSTGARVH